MISVRDLRYTYKGNQRETLHGFDFDIQKGEIFGFLGPSGAGKSTTQKILFGLLKNYAGQVKIMDQEISQWDARLYENIGISFELPNHYSNLTALENLEYFQTLYKETYDLEQVLKWVGLEEAAQKRVSNFSKGMKVRLNVARSIIHKPKILFLDEPTSGLDPVNARNIKDLILKLRASGTTAFITTHNMMVAEELCDRVAFITNGKIKIIDSPLALKKKYGKQTVIVHYKQNKTEKSSEFPLPGLGENKDFIDLLNSGHKIEALHSQETSLEKIFIQITGEELAS